jgi:Na+/proline symporter
MRASLSVFSTKQDEKTLLQFKKISRFSMIPAWQLIVIFLLYVASLFLVAWFGDKRAQEQRPVHNNGWVYALSLGVYCTSWTFYGAVGQAASSGWLFLAIYVGPILFFLFFWRLLHKIIRIAKEKRLTSIADFIGTRYGKDHSLAIVITLVALVSIIPYVALQLKAIATTFELISTTYHGENLTTEFWQDTAFYISAAMAIFVIIFGTRDIDASEQHPGMMLAIAFESLIKLSALWILGSKHSIQLPRRYFRDCASSVAPACSFRWPSHFAGLCLTNAFSGAFFIVPTSAISGCGD